MTRTYTETELEKAIEDIIYDYEDMSQKPDLWWKHCAGNIMSLVKAATWLKRERELPISDRIPKHPDYSTEWMAYHEGQNSLLQPDSKGVRWRSSVDWTNDTPETDTPPPGVAELE